LSAAYRRPLPPLPQQRQKAEAADNCRENIFQSEERRLPGKRCVFFLSPERENGTN
jgi:hypothetical protein